VAIPDFPNFFMITGPKGPFSNIPPAIEAQVEFVTDAIEMAEKADKESKKPIEPTHEAERAYSKLCDELASASLFWKAAVSANAFSIDQLRSLIGK
jgi:hypothetical protein